MSNKMYAFKLKDSTQYLTDDGGCVIFGSTEQYFKDYFIDHPDTWRRLGLYDDQGLLIDICNMEIVEWIPRRPFLYAVELENTFEVDGLAEITTVNINDNEKKLLVTLKAGGLQFGNTEKTEEGYESNFMTVAEGFDKIGQPIWIIEWSTYARDCDGKYENTSYYESKGGKRNIDTMLENILKNSETFENEDDKNKFIDNFKNEYAIEEFRSEFKRSDISSHQRDYSAEAAGY